MSKTLGFTVFFLFVHGPVWANEEATVASRVEQLCEEVWPGIEAEKKEFIGKFFEDTYNDIPDIGLAQYLTFVKSSLKRYSDFRLTQIAQLEVYFQDGEGKLRESFIKGIRRFPGGEAAGKTAEQLRVMSQVLLAEMCAWLEEIDVIAIRKEMRGNSDMLLRGLRFMLAADNLRTRGRDGVLDSLNAQLVYERFKHHCTAVLQIAKIDIEAKLESMCFDVRGNEFISTMTVDEDEFRRRVSSLLSRIPTSPLVLGATMDLTQIYDILLIASSNRKDAEEKSEMFFELFSRLMEEYEENPEAFRHFRPDVLPF